MLELVAIGWQIVRWKSQMAVERMHATNCFGVGAGVKVKVVMFSMKRNEVSLKF